MNRAELRQLLRNHVAEGGTGTFSDAELNAALNTAQNQLAARFALLPSVGQAVVTGHLLTLPANFLAFGHEDIRADSGAVLRREALSDVLASDPGAFTPGARNAPLRAFVWEEGLSWDGQVGPSAGLYPNASSERLTFVYYRRPGGLDGEQSVPWDGAHADWHDLVALYAARTLQAQQGPSAAATAVWHQLLDARIQEFSEHRRTQAASRSVRFVSRRGKGGFSRTWRSA